MWQFIHIAPYGGLREEKYKYGQGLCKTLNEGLIKY